MWVSLYDVYSVQHLLTFLDKVYNISRVSYLNATGLFSIYEMYLQMTLSVVHGYGLDVSTFCVYSYILATYLFFSLKTIMTFQMLPGQYVYFTNKCYQHNVSLCITCTFHFTSFTRIYRKCITRYTKENLVIDILAHLSTKCSC